MMRITFSGTRTGMTRHQKEEFKWHLMNQPLWMFRPNQFHHGLCVGADCDAHTLVREIESIPFEIHGHPSTLISYQAPDSIKNDCDYVLDPLPPLTRNEVMVDWCQLLIATPNTRNRNSRSGTWTTIRKALRHDIPVIIIPPEAL